MSERQTDRQTDRGGQRERGEGQKGKKSCVSAIMAPDFMQPSGRASTLHPCTSTRFLICFSTYTGAELGNDAKESSLAEEEKTHRRQTE